MDETDMETVDTTVESVLESETETETGVLVDVQFRTNIKEHLSNLENISLTIVLALGLIFGALIVKVFSC